MSRLHRLRARRQKCPLPDRAPLGVVPGFGAGAPGDELRVLAAQDAGVDDRGAVVARARALGEICGRKSDGGDGVACRAALRAGRLGAGLAAEQEGEEGRHPEETCHNCLSSIIFFHFVMLDCTLSLAANRQKP